jgi:hypothetical protein
VLIGVTNDGAGVSPMRRDREGSLELRRKRDHNEAADSRWIASRELGVPSRSVFLKWRSAMTDPGWTYGPAT